MRSKPHDGVGNWVAVRLTWWFCSTYLTAGLPATLSACARVIFASNPRTVFHARTTDPPCWWVNRAAAFSTSEVVAAAADVLSTTMYELAIAVGPSAARMVPSGETAASADILLNTVAAATAAANPSVAMRRPRRPKMINTSFLDSIHAHGGARSWDAMVLCSLAPSNPPEWLVTPARD